jgi:hypothetical protein
MSDEKDSIMKDDPASGDAGHSPKDRTEKVKSGAETRFPKIDFATFIFSLNSAVLVHLGQIADPATDEKAKNLTLAKQTIDILAMLEEKTKGNLDKDEAGMLKNILYDLRIIYVRECG